MRGSGKMVEEASQMGNRSSEKMVWSGRLRRAMRWLASKMCEEKPVASGWKDVEGANGKRPAEMPIVGWRLWLFRVAAVVFIPAVVFLLVEFGLRVGGYGFPASAIVGCRVNGEDAYRDNVRFGWRFFPPKISREFTPFVFPADKGEDTYRVFVVGSSAAKGTPEPAFGLGRMLRVMLQRRYPAVNFEVITAGMPGINSHVELEITKDCARHRPDLFVVYLGNNEVTGPYGPGTVFAPLSGSITMIRAGIVLKSLRIGQLLTNMVGWLGAEKDTPAMWGGVEMFLGKEVRADDPRLEKVYRHFQTNLEDICRVARGSGAEVILCTVGTNARDWPPFSSLHRIGLTEAEKQEWQGVYEVGAAHETGGRYGEAAQCYLAADEIDGGYADLQFRLGRCYWAMGEFEKARERYVRARELDTLRFRADSRINQIIGAVARARSGKGVFYVDVDGAFEQNSPGRTAGRELFYDHVHMNFAGNYLAARTVFEQVTEIVPQRVRDKQTTVGKLPSEQECAELLAYTDWDRYRIAEGILNQFTKEAPFARQLYHEQRVGEAQRALKVLRAVLETEGLEGAAGRYREAIRKDPNDWYLRWKYAALLAEGLRDSEAAVQQYRLVLERVPHNFHARAALALELASLGRFEEAIANNLEAIRIKPTYHVPYYNLALVYLRRGQSDKAIDCYYEVVRLMPYHGEAYQNLGALLSQRGRSGEAERILRKGLEFLPDDPDLHHNLGAVLAEQGRKDEAIKELREALRTDPNAVDTQRVLRSILQGSN